MGAYLFVRFREKIAPDGEQVHFALSRDGFHWEAVHQGLPVLFTYYGSRGARDFTICRCRHTGKFHIIATDLSLAYGMRNEFQHAWDAISRHCSKYLSHWVSKDLVHWSEQQLLSIGDEAFGCMWAPDVIYDSAQDPHGAFSFPYRFNDPAHYRRGIRAHCQTRLAGGSIRKESIIRISNQFAPASYRERGAAAQTPSSLRASWIHSI